MNSDDPFQNRLHRQRWRELPPGWREEILGAAAEASPKESLAGRGTLAAADLWRVLREWMWPHPRAWAGVASLWFLVLVLNWPAGEASTESPAFAKAATHISPQAREMLREQQRWLAELAGAAQPAGMARPTEPAAPWGGRRGYETNV